MRLSFILLASVLTLPALAADIKIENAWVRAPAPGQQVVGGFMDITSPRDAKLISVSSNVAGTTELHEMRMKDGVMIMRPVQHIVLPKGQTVKLEPGGLHIMLIDLKKPLKSGDKIDIRLKIKQGNKQESVKVNAEVRDPMTAVH